MSGKRFHLGAILSICFGKIIPGYEGEVLTLIRYISGEEFIDKPLSEKSANLAEHLRAQIGADFCDEDMPYFKDARVEWVHNLTRKYGEMHLITPISRNGFSV